MLERSESSGVFLLALVIATAAVIAACGASAPRAPSAAGSETDAGTLSASGSVSGTGTASATAVSTPGPMKPPRASEMVGDLLAIGLDAKSLPPLEKLEPDKLRKVMKLFARSLGVKCADCHADGSRPGTEPAMDAMTPRKKVAVQMWSRFVRGMATSDGSPVFCDSCHQGSLKILDRHDRKAAEKWMEDNYVGKLERKDGQENDCATCHGEASEYHFIDLWKQGKRFP